MIPEEQLQAFEAHWRDCSVCNQCEYDTIPELLKAFKEVIAERDFLKRWRDENITTDTEYLEDYLHRGWQFE